MGLIDYVVQRDKFQADEVINGFDFPCGVCIHRHGTDMDEPCMTCDHNLRSVPDEDDGKTPRAPGYASAPLRNGLAECEREGFGERLTKGPASAGPA